MPAASLVAVQEQLEALAAHHALEPGERRRGLRALRTELEWLLGVADRLIADQHLAEESEHLEWVEQRAELRENATIREELIRRKLASPEQLDDTGYLSHEALDQLESDGELVEAFGNVRIDPRKLAQIARGRRRNQGRFADEFGSKPKAKGRGGGAMKGTPNTPGGSSAQARTRATAAAQANVPAPQSPARSVSPPGLQPGGSYEERKGELDKRVASELRQRKPPQSPGSERKDPLPETGPVADPNAPRTASGKVSQKQLLAFAAGAASQPTTVEAYSRREPDGRRVYDTSRKAEHDRIIEKVLSNIPSQAPGQARVFFSGGGYASGKGGVVDTHPDAPPPAYKHPDDPQRALVLDPDQIKAELPEFDEMLEHDPEANLLVYEEAWDISQAIQAEAIKRNMNIIVDGISDTSPEDMTARVKQFIDAGYQRPKAVYVSIPTDEAIKRAAKRAAKAKKRSDRRFIPEVVMRAVHRDVSATLPGVVESAKELGFDVEVWDNNQGTLKDENGNEVFGTDGKPEFAPPKQFFSYTAAQDSEKVIESDLWDQFLAKANEDIAGVDDVVRAPRDVPKVAARKATKGVVRAHTSDAYQKAHEKVEKLEGAPLDVIKDFLGNALHNPHVHEVAASALHLVSGAVVPDPDLEESEEVVDENAEGEGPKLGDGVIDLPWESGSADPQPIAYEDLGPTKKYVAGESFRDAQARSLDQGEFAGDEAVSPDEEPKE